MRLWILLLLTLSLSACVSIKERQKQSALDSMLYSYHTAMRWGHWDTLFSYRAAEAPEPPALDLENIRVTNYEVRQPPVEVKENTVIQVAEIQYVLRDRQRVHRLYDKQEWRFEPESKQWRVFSPFPAFQ